MNSEQLLNYILHAETNVQSFITGVNTHLKSPEKCGNEKLYMLENIARSLIRKCKELLEAIEVKFGSLTLIRELIVFFDNTSNSPNILISTDNPNRKQFRAIRLLVAKIEKKSECQRQFEIFDNYLKSLIFIEERYKSQFYLNKEINNLKVKHLAKIDVLIDGKFAKNLFKSSIEEILSDFVNEEAADKILDQHDLKDVLRIAAEILLYNNIQLKDMVTILTRQMNAFEYKLKKLRSVREIRKFIPSDLETTFQSDSLVPLYRQFAFSDQLTEEDSYEPHYRTVIIADLLDTLIDQINNHQFEKFEKSNSHVNGKNSIEKSSFVYIIRELKIKEPTTTEIPIKSIQQTQIAQRKRTHYDDSKIVMNDLLVEKSNSHVNGKNSIEKSSFVYIIRELKIKEPTTTEIPIKSIQQIEIAQRKRTHYDDSKIVMNDLLVELSIIKSSITEDIDFQEFIKFVLGQKKGSFKHFEPILIQDALTIEGYVRSETIFHIIQSFRPELTKRLMMIIYPRFVAPMQIFDVFQQVLHFLKEDFGSMDSAHDATLLTFHKSGRYLIVWCSTDRRMNPGEQLNQKEFPMGFMAKTKGKIITSRRAFFLSTSKNELTNGYRITCPLFNPNQECFGVLVIDIKFRGQVEKIRKENMVHIWLVAHILSNHAVVLRSLCHVRRIYKEFSDIIVKRCVNKIKHINFYWIKKVADREGTLDIVAINEQETGSIYKIILESKTIKYQYLFDCLRLKESCIVDLMDETHFIVLIKIPVTNDFVGMVDINLGINDCVATQAAKCNFYGVILNDLLDKKDTIRQERGFYDALCFALLSDLKDQIQNHSRLTDCDQQSRELMRAVIGSADISDSEIVQWLFRMALSANQMDEMKHGWNWLRSTRKILNEMSISYIGEIFYCLLKLRG